MMSYITFVQILHLIQPLFLCYKHCHVAKAPFTVASVDAIVILTVLQYRYKPDFLEKLSSRQKKCLFKRSKRYYAGNKCMQTKSRFLVLSFHITLQCEESVSKRKEYESWGFSVSVRCFNFTSSKMFTYRR